MPFAVSAVVLTSAVAAAKSGYPASAQKTPQYAPPTAAVEVGYFLWSV